MPQTSERERPSIENGASALNDRVRSLRLTQQPGVRSRNAVLPWALCVILLMTTAAFGYRAYRVGALTPTTPASEDAAPAVAPASTATVASSGEVVLQSKGYVIPAHQVQVSPKVGGMILKLHERFEEGQYFKKDEILAELESVDYQADYDRAVAAEKAAVQRLKESKGSPPEEIAASRNELKESEATLQQLKLDLRRSERLVGTDALTTKEYELAKFAHDSMKRRVDRLHSSLDIMIRGARVERQDAAQADLEAAKSDVAKADWRLKNCRVRAPIDGHILTKKAELGALVNPLAFTIAGTLCDMADLAKLEIDLSVQERDIARVSKGQRCTIMPEAFQNHEPFRKRHPQGYDGRVIRLMPIADRSKGAINVRVEVDKIPNDEVGMILKPEMSVLVSFLKLSK